MLSTSMWWVPNTFEARHAFVTKSYILLSIYCVEQSRYTWQCSNFGLANQITGLLPSMAMNKRADKHTKYRKQKLPHIPPCTYVRSASHNMLQRIRNNYRIIYIICVHPITRPLTLNNYYTFNEVYQRKEGTIYQIRFYMFWSVLLKDIIYYMIRWYFMITVFIRNKYSLFWYCLFIVSHCVKVVMHAITLIE